VKSLLAEAEIYKSVMKEVTGVEWWRSASAAV
jgi:hypothetical protein